MQTVWRGGHTGVQEVTSKGHVTSRAGSRDCGRGFTRPLREVTPRCSGNFCLTPSSPPPPADFVFYPLHFQRPPAPSNTIISRDNGRQAQGSGLA